MIYFKTRYVQELYILFLSTFPIIGNMHVTVDKKRMYSAWNNVLNSRYQVHICACTLVEVGAPVNTCILVFENDFSPCSCLIQGIFHFVIHLFLLSAHISLTINLSVFIVSSQSNDYYYLYTCYKYWIRVQILNKERHTVVEVGLGLLVIYSGVCMYLLCAYTECVCMRPTCPIIRYTS